MSPQTNPKDRQDWSVPYRDDAPWVEVTMHGGYLDPEGFRVVKLPMVRGADWRWIPPDRVVVRNFEGELLGTFERRGDSRDYDWTPTHPRDWRRQALWVG